MSYPCTKAHYLLATRVRKELQSCALPDAAALVNSDLFADPPHNAKYLYKIYASILEKIIHEAIRYRLLLLFYNTLISGYP